MEREDYLLRVVRDFARVIARVLGLKDTGQYAEALVECENAIGLVSGIDPRIVRNFRAPDVIAFMKMGSETDVRRIEQLSQLLELEASLHELEGRDAEAGARRRQARDLRDAASLPGC